MKKYFKSAILFFAVLSSAKIINANKDFNEKNQTKESILSKELPDQKNKSEKKVNFKNDVEERTYPVGPKEAINNKFKRQEDGNYYDLNPEKIIKI